jgi:hypothetical protein
MIERIRCQVRRFDTDYWDLRFQYSYRYRLCSWLCDYSKSRASILPKNELHIAEIILSSNEMRNSTVITIYRPHVLYDTLRIRKPGSPEYGMIVCGKSIEQLAPQVHQYIQSSTRYNRTLFLRIEV